MARPPRPPHELRLRNHHGRAVCTYRGTVYHFGAWDAQADAPTPEALTAFREQQDRWAGDPAAAPAGAAGEGEPLAAVWGAWLKTPHAPKDRRGDNRRAGVELFGTPTAPGPFRGLTADRLTAAAVLAWQDSLCARELSRYTVGRLVGFLRRCLAWGAVAGLVPPEVVAAVGRVPAPPKGSTPAPRRRRGVSWERVEAAAGRFRSAPAADLLRLLWWTGARPSELGRLTVGGILTAGTVRPDKGQPVPLGRCWAAVLGEHKTADGGGERCVFFGPRAQLVLSPYLKGRGADRLFRTRRGGEYTYRLLDQSIERVSETAGEDPFTVYQIRHAFAERVQSHYSGILPGAGWLAAQAAMGHKVRGVTTIYSGSDWTTAEKVAFELG
jgi:integrase